jgi:hypothetical protein
VLRHGAAPFAVLFTYKEVTMIILLVAERTLRLAMAIETAVGTVVSITAFYAAFVRGKRTS